MSSKDDRYDVDGADDGLDSGDNTGSEAGSTPSDQSSEEASSEAVDETASQGELPHRVRYDSPHTERESLTIYVDAEDEARIDELYSLARQTFDEKVHRTDVYVAALRCDISDDDAFLAEMRNIGYAYFD
jgi:hypothetical protein